MNTPPTSRQPSLTPEAQQRLDECRTQFHFEHLILSDPQGILLAASPSTVTTLHETLAAYAPLLAHKSKKYRIALLRELLQLEPSLQGKNLRAQALTTPQGLIFTCGILPANTSPHPQPFQHVLEELRSFFEHLP